MIENRQLKRIAINLPLEFGCAEKTFNGFCLNLSINGLFIATWLPLPEDAHIWLRFNLPGDTDILFIHSRVVWTKYDSKASPCGMGIEFIRMSHEHRRKIRDFIEKNLAAPGTAHVRLQSSAADEFPQAQGTTG